MFITWVEKFLQLNGWDLTDEDSNYRCFVKDGCASIDIEHDKIVFFDETGDFLHLPMDKFALIGALIEYHQIGFSYKTPEV